MLLQRSQHVYSPLFVFLSLSLALSPSAAEDTDMVEEQKISTSGRKENSAAKSKMARLDKKKQTRGKVSKRTVKKSATFRFHTGKK